MAQMFENFTKLAIGALTVAIILAMTFVLLAQTKTQAEGLEGLDYSNASQCATSFACNGTNEIESGIADIPGWIPLAILAAIAVAILGIVRGLNRA